MTPSTVGGLTRPTSEEHTYTTPEGDHSAIGPVSAHKSPLPPRPLPVIGTIADTTESPPRPTGKKPDADGVSPRPLVRTVDFGVSPASPPRPPKRDAVGAVSFGDFAFNEPNTTVSGAAGGDSSMEPNVNSGTRSTGYAFSNLHSLPPTAATPWNDTVNRKISYSLAMHGVHNAAKMEETTTDEMSVIDEDQTYVSRSYASYMPTLLLSSSCDDAGTVAWAPCVCSSCMCARIASGVFG